MNMKKTKMMGLLLAGCCGMAAAADSPHEKVPPELRSCVGIERNTERLSCYDRGVAALLGAEGATAPSAESSFGLVAQTPRAEVARSASAAEDVQKIGGKVTAVALANDGTAVVTLDNGQVWRQLSGGQLLIKVGDDVEINRAALGSFQMKVPSGRSGKMKRIR
ncbi:MAG TPA: hypothetical protein VM146_16280 [Steroidobacteraceae bacterium]|nr:hypothetical protein [Steroidobacteraceae bacterium]